MSESVEPIPLRARVKFVGGWVALLWVIEIVDTVLPVIDLDSHGIHPRSVAGLWGIFTSPFLHGGIAHLLSNSVPLFILGTLVFMRGMGQFFTVTLTVVVVGGLGVWLIGAGNSNHIGASGVIFGYLGFLLAIGVFERSLKAIVTALVVGFLYGGVIWGVLPTRPGVSWEGHLFGLLAGILTAKLMSAGGDKQSS